MVMRLVLVMVVVVCTLGVAHANFQPFVPQSAQAFIPTPVLVHYNREASFSMGLKKFINSFTSYQFPNPFQARQDPLSRLEFPLDQWFVGVATRYALPWFALSANVWININKQSAQRMQDSDWDDDFDSQQKTIFSESKCKLNRGTLLDIGAVLTPSFINPYPIKPVLGYRFQRFAFTTHDGTQWGLGYLPADLPGDGIDFTQSFQHGYLGLNMRMPFNLRSFYQTAPLVILEMQADYAFVNGFNEDVHLLRGGDRVTTQRTSGHCWHFAAVTQLFKNESLTARLEADFKRIITHGSHRLENPSYSLDMSFDGARVWSDQFSLAAVGVVRF